MKNIEFLPYRKIKNNKELKEIAKFILKKIKKIIKNKYTFHFLIISRKDKMLQIIQKMSKKYPYFLRLDIEKYYPSIDHQILLNILKKILKSRRGQKILKQKIPLFLNKTGVQNKGLPLGNYLSYILAEVYLLPLDFQLIKSKKYFLRYGDDYLIFCKNKKEPLKILKEIVEPELNKLKLTLNIKKLNSGRFHQIPFDFLGFRYYGGIFTISQDKIEEFKKKISKITHLTKKKPIKAIIKLLNYQILGFSNYYKISSSKEIFRDLDSFIRQRLRRYILKTKDQKQKLNNLILTNKYLENLGLKSLLKIKEKYDLKNRDIFSKKKKKLKKMVLEKKILLRENLLKNKEFFYLKLIFEKLEEIAKNTLIIKKEIQKIKKILNKEKTFKLKKNLL
ncbi:MAG: reverse transcriptase domain-containing protein [Candidatus Paceibacterota bacterium]